MRSHRVSQQLVELSNLGRDAVVDCAVTHLDDDAAQDLGIDLNIRLAIVTYPQFGWQGLIGTKG